MPTLLASTNITGIQLKEGAAASNPASGYMRLYATSDGSAFHVKTDTGADLNVTGIVTGGIAITSQATGDLIVASSASQLGLLPDVAVGQILKSGGVGAAPAWTDTLLTPKIGAAIDAQDNVISRAVLKDYGETRTAPTISGNTLTLDLTTGNVFSVSLSANITTLTISNPPASGTAGSFTVLFTADGTVRAITWGSSVKWPGGVAPTMTGTSGKVDLVSMCTVDGGTTWYATVSQNY